MYEPDHGLYLATSVQCGMMTTMPLTLLQAEKPNIAILSSGDWEKRTCFFRSLGKFVSRFIQKQILLIVQKHSKELLIINVEFPFKIFLFQKE